MNLREKVGHKRNRGPSDIKEVLMYEVKILKRKLHSYF